MTGIEEHADADNEESFFSPFQDIELDKPERRVWCPRCGRPERVCVCFSFPNTPFPLSTTVHILQHPREQDFRLLTTVPLLRECVPHDKCIIYRGKRFGENKFPDLHKICRMEDTIVLYPAPDSVSIEHYLTERKEKEGEGCLTTATREEDCLTTKTREGDDNLATETRTGEEDYLATTTKSIEEGNLSTTTTTTRREGEEEESDTKPQRRSVHMIVLDGTWREAKSIYFNNKYLHGLKKVKLTNTSCYGKSAFVIKTQPNNASLSTCEAVAIAIGQLEGKPELLDVVRKPLKALCDFQLSHGAQVHQSKEELASLGIKYRCFEKI